MFVIKLRRFLRFMLHPNHKLQTRLQLIKRLLNTPNSETIYKHLFTNDNNNPQSNQLNTKLMFYLNLLIEQKQDTNEIMSNNDKEILNHLNEMFNLTFLTTNNSFKINKHLQQQQQQQQNSANYTQFDKEINNEIINIYSKSKDIFNQYIKQCDLAMRSNTDSTKQTLNDYINELNLDLFNTCITDVLKNYFQSIKIRHDKSYDLKQKWMQIINNMTHEHCLWYSCINSPKFYTLDQTEGPNRERRRLKKSHLYIEEKFFKKEVYAHVNCEKISGKFEYLLCHEDDFNINDDSLKAKSYGIDDPVAYYLRNSIILQ